MTTEPNGKALAMALDVGEVVFVPEGRFVVTESPTQAEAGELRVMAIPLDENTDEEIELRFSRPDSWVKIFRRIAGDG